MQKELSVDIQKMASQAFNANSLSEGYNKTVLNWDLDNSMN